MVRQDTHLFALYYPESSHCAQEVTLTDPDLVHRINHVLRLRTGERFILFDKTVHLHVQLISVSKASISIQVIERSENISLTPPITLLLPLLKKDSLEQALYNATEMGATSLQLLITAKSRQSLTEKEWGRLKRIIIAAAEQSKQFVLPELKRPIAFDTSASKSFEKAAKLYADPAGTPLFNLLPSTKGKDLLIMVGPEGDLVQEEKELLVELGFAFCRLTPTVLRSYQAATLLVGVCRTYFS